MHDAKIFLIRGILMADLFILDKPKGVQIIWKLDDRFIYAANGGIFEMR